MSQISRIRSEGPKKGAKEEGASMPKAPKQADHRRLLDAHGAALAASEREQISSKVRQTASGASFSTLSETHFANINDNHLDGFSPH